MKFRQSLFDRIVAWSPALLLGALAAMTYWLDAQVRAPPPKFDGSGRHDADLYIENFKAASLDDKGRIHQALIARVARHYPDDDSTDLEGPQITFNDPGKPRLTKEDKIVTDKAVTIADPRGIINATGMEYDNKSKTIKLRSRVSGQIEPQQK